MFLDTAIYNEKNLKSEDKKSYENMNEFKEALISEETVDDYIESTNNGKYTSQLLKEVLIPFVKYVREAGDYILTDFVVSTIDKYSDEYMKSVLKNSKADIERD